MLHRVFFSVVHSSMRFICVILFIYYIYYWWWNRNRISLNSPSTEHNLLCYMCKWNGRREMSFWYNIILDIDMPSTILHVKNKQTKVICFFVGNYYYCWLVSFILKYNSWMNEWIVCDWIEMYDFHLLYRRHGTGTGRLNKIKYKSPPQNVLTAKKNPKRKMW